MVAPRHRRFPWLHLAWALPVALASCAAPPPPQAFLNRQVTVALPRPAALGHGWHASQLLSADYGGQKGQIPVELEVQGDWLTLVGLSALGPPIFTIRYDGNQIIAEHKAIDVHSLPPAQILADVMLVYWPRSAWMPLLPPGWRLDDEGAERRLFDDTGTLVLQIHTDGPVDRPHTVDLTNHIFHYQIKIVTYSSKFW
jgi:hypothetical protein